MKKERLTIPVKKIWFHAVGWGLKLKAQEIYRHDNEAFIKLISKTNCSVDHMIVPIEKITRRNK